MANDPNVSRDRGPAIRQMSLRFDDGSIVLRVERTLLRVHRTILCTYSKIFADMFNIPQVKGEATVEGCTIVYPPDKATDFGFVATLFYFCKRGVKSSMYNIRLTR